MLETSQDLFYLVLAFCVLWLTVFLCWALYYMIRMLKQTNQFLEDVKQKIERVSSLFGFLKSKLFTEALKGLSHLVWQNKNKKEK